MTRGPRDGGGGIRAFVALEVDPAMRARIAEGVERLVGTLAGVRWLAPAGVHLTLRFLGESSADVLDRLTPRLRGAAAACPPAEARVSGLGLFPERGNPRVLWLGIALPAPALALQAACEEAAVAGGFPPEARPFRSHLTLGRWRERVPRPELPHFDLGTTALETLVLFRSDLKPQGAVYTPLASFRLGGGPE